MTEGALRAYLLGKLADTEVKLVENRLIEDEDLFSQMETAEDDLFDAYARGTLDEDERARFLERFAGDVARRRFAKAFVARTASAKVVPFYRRRWVELALAASLVIVVGSFVSRQDPERVSPAPSTPPAAQAPIPATVIARVPLALGTSRAAGEPVRVSVDPTVTQVDFGVRLNPADRFAVYAIEIRSRVNNIVWADVALTAALENGDLIVHAIVPSDRLPAGSFEMSVRGGAAASSLDELGFLAIEVHRAQ